MTTPIGDLQERKKKLEEELQKLQLEIDAVESMDTLTRLACEIHHHFHFRDDDDWWYTLKNGVPDGTGNAFLTCKAKAKNLLDVIEFYDTRDFEAGGLWVDQALKVIEALSLRSRK